LHQFQCHVIIDDWSAMFVRCEIAHTVPRGTAYNCSAMFVRCEIAHTVPRGTANNCSAMFVRCEIAHTVPRGTAVCRMRVNVSLAAYATCDRTASTLELQATLSAQSLVHWLSSREVSSTLTLDISSSVCHFTTNTAIIIHFFTFTTLAGLR